MKYILTLLFVAGIFFSAQSQLWFDAGVSGSYGPTALLDRNVFDSGNYKHKLTAGNAFGGRLGINFGHHAGISAEFSSATSKQDFNLNSRVYNSYKLKHNDLMLLFRYSGNGAFVEIGGQYSIMGDVTRTTEGIPAAADVSDDFDNFMGGVFGFGSYLLGDDLFTVNIGIRFHYGFQDALTEAGKPNFYPAQMDNAGSLDLDKKTVVAGAQLKLEANYAWGRFAKTACHDRWKLILFN